MNTNNSMDTNTVLVSKYLVLAKTKPNEEGISKRVLIAHLNEHGDVIQYMVGYNYDPKQEEGKQWDNGHYYPVDKLTFALDDYYDRISRMRLEELAKLFKDGLLCDDKETALEYFRSKCCMTMKECDFFEVEF